MARTILKGSNISHNTPDAAYRAQQGGKCPRGQARKSLPRGAQGELLRTEMRKHFRLEVQKFVSELTAADPAILTELVPEETEKKETMHVSRKAIELLHEVCFEYLVHSFQIAKDLSLAVTQRVRARNGIPPVSDGLIIKSMKGLAPYSFEHHLRNGLFGPVAAYRLPLDGEKLELAKEIFKQ